MFWSKVFDVKLNLNAWKLTNLINSWILKGNDHLGRHLQYKYICSVIFRTVPFGQSQNLLVTAFGTVNGFLFKHRTTNTMISHSHQKDLQRLKQLWFYIFDVHVHVRVRIHVHIVQMARNTVHVLLQILMAQHAKHQQSWM